MVGKTGFEPAALWSQTRCATKLRHFPKKVCLVVLVHFVKKNWGAYRGQTMASFVCNLLFLFIAYYAITYFFGPL